MTQQDCKPAFPSEFTTLFVLWTAPLCSRRVLPLAAMLSRQASAW